MDRMLDRPINGWMGKMVFCCFQGTQGPAGLIGAAGESGLKVRKNVNFDFEDSLCTQHGFPVTKCIHEVLEGQLTVLTLSLHCTVLVGPTNPRIN